MKAKGTPEKIYLQVCGDCQDNDCDNCKFEDLEDNVTWCEDRIFDKDVEYIRADAFIEKALDYIENNIYDHYDGDHEYGICGGYVKKEDFIENFKNYIRG